MIVSSDYQQVIGFAGFAVAVESQSVGLIDMLRSCYAGFLQGEPGFRLKTVVYGPPKEHAPNAARGGQVEIRRGRGRVMLRSHDFDALIDLAAREIQTWQPCAVYPVDMCLRVAYASLHGEHGGVLLHASGVLRDGLAWVFCGPSGAGKSTIAELLGGTRLADELIAVRRSGNGFLASGTPYWMGTSISAPIGGVFHLRQADSTFVRGRPPEETVAELLASVEAPGVDEPTAAGIAGFCRDLADTRACGELSFRPDAVEIWREICRYSKCGQGDQVVL